jgi:hypothetical protein
MLSALPNFNIELQMCMMVLSGDGGSGSRSSSSSSSNVSSSSSSSSSSSAISSVTAIKQNDRHHIFNPIHAMNNISCTKLLEFLV